MLYVLQNLHWFLVLLGSLVFFHELGHFLAARAFGVRVLSFSLGFGPKLFSKTYKDTEYRIGLLPLGGYVKMLGEQPGVDVLPEEQAVSFQYKPVWQRAVIAFAGPAANFILAFVLYIVLFTGERTVGDTRLGIVTPHEPAWNAGIRAGDRILSVDHEPVANWDEFKEKIAARFSTSVHVVYERGGVEHAVELHPVAHAESNAFEEKETRGKIGVSFQYLKPMIAIVDDHSPAALAGLKTNDEIVQVEHHSVQAWHEVKRLIAQAHDSVHLQVKRETALHDVTLTPIAMPESLAQITDLENSADMPGGYLGLVNRDAVVQAIEKNSPAERSGLHVGDRLVALIDARGEKRLIHHWLLDLMSVQMSEKTPTFTIVYQRGTELHEGILTLAEREEVDEFKTKHKTTVFGATNNADGMDSYVRTEHISVLGAVKESAIQVWEDMALIGKGLARMFSGKMSTDSVGGPMMLFVIAEKSASKGWQQFVRMLGVVSVNLGLLNLLPVPVLDGGHLVFFAYEALRRKPPSLKARELANTIGLGLLLALMLLAFKNDVMRFIFGS